MSLNVDIFFLWWLCQLLYHTPTGRKCRRRSCLCMISIARIPHVVTLALPAMTQNPIGDSCSIFKDGKLKSGIYKIQNILTENYLDIEVHSRQVCCRPAKDLGEGRGLVSRYLLCIAHISDNWKWEIKDFGAGYTVKMVSVTADAVRWNAICHCTLKITKYRLNLGNLSSFVSRWWESWILHFPSRFILWVGELKS